jgi:hypothetical protein
MYRRAFTRREEIRGTFSARGPFSMIGRYSASRAATPKVEVIECKMEQCIARGFGDVDWSAVQEATRYRAGLAQNKVDSSR